MHAARSFTLTPVLIQVRATTALMALARSHPDLIEIGHAKNRKEYRSGNGLVAGQLALCKASRPEDPTVGEMLSCKPHCLTR